MPLNFRNNSEEAIESMFSAINGSLFKVTCAPYKRNINGTSKGILVGGNLSIIYSLLSSDYTNARAFRMATQIIITSGESVPQTTRDNMMACVKTAMS